MSLRDREAGDEGFGEEVPGKLKKFFPMHHRIMIRTIHQTWKNNTPEDRFPPEWIRSWKELNPGWEYRLWTDEDLRDFVRDRYPAFFPVWCSFPKQIMRVDAWRFLVLKEQGGLYVDLDFVCLEPLDGWLTAHERFACADQGNKIFCNAFMWAPDPRSPFLEDIEQEMVKSAWKPHAFDVAGPDFLQRYSAGREKWMSEIKTEQVYPLPFWNRPGLARVAGKDAAALRKAFPSAKAFTFWTGTWDGEDHSLVEPETPDARQGQESPPAVAMVLTTDPEKPHLVTVQGDTWMDGCDLAVTRFDAGDRGEDPPLALLFKGALHAEWDWLFVGKESTYVVPERLRGLIPAEADLVTNEAILVEGKPSRAAGYLVSRKLAGWILENAPQARESDLAGVMKAHGFRWSVTPLLRHDSARFPSGDNGIVSSSSEDPRDLLLYHSAMHAGCSLRARCTHEGWQGELVFYESGICCRPGSGDGGFWQELEDGNVIIDWFRWPREIFIRVTADGGVLMSAKRASFAMGRDLMEIEMKIGG